MQKNYWLKKIDEIFTVLVAVLSSVWAMIGEYVIDISSFLVVTYVLLLTDFVTGILASNTKKDTFTSRRLYRTVEKIFVYSLAIIISKWMAVTFGLQSFRLTYVVAFVIALTEFKSNLENIEVITGTPLWSAVSRKLRKWIKIIPGMSDSKDKS